jgi:hypothetical protein
MSKKTHDPVSLYSCSWLSVLNAILVSWPSSEPHSVFTQVLQSSAGSV